MLQDIANRIPSGAKDFPELSGAANIGITTSNSNNRDRTLVAGRVG
jgi:hypothetical protein